MSDPRPLSLANISPAREQKPIPDQLAELRTKIAALKAEAEALRDILAEDPTARIGAEYVAVMRTTVSQRVSSKALREADSALFAKLAQTQEVTAVVLKRRCVE